MSTLHCALENGADLYVNEHQTVRHYRARSTEERRKRIRRKKKKNAKSRFFYFARSVHKRVLYSNNTLVPLEISHRTRWWCLKCVIVYLVQDIPAFVMYCVNGESGSSLLIESTDSMIMQGIPLVFRLPTVHHLYCTTSLSWLCLHIGQ